VGAAEHLAVLLESVTEYPAAAVAAHWCDTLRRTLEAVERIRATLVPNLECFVVVIAAEVASRHQSSSFLETEVLQRKSYPP
jgi:hypothetical protein